MTRACQSGQLGNEFGFRIPLKPVGVPGRRRVRVPRIRVQPQREMLDDQFAKLQTLRVEPFRRVGLDRHVRRGGVVRTFAERRREREYDGFFEVFKCDDACADDSRPDHGLDSHAAIGPHGNLRIHRKGRQSWQPQPFGHEWALGRGATELKAAPRCSPEFLGDGFQQGTC